jgi:hypothetical protein
VGTEQALAKDKVPYKIADIAAVLCPTPNIFVRSGDILSYEVYLKNYGPGKASHVYVQIPFNPNHVTPLDCSFQDSKKGWVDEILTLDDGRGHVQLEFKGSDVQYDLHRSGKDAGCEQSAQWYNYQWFYGLWLER